MKRGRKKNPENIAPGSQPQGKAIAGEMIPPDHLNSAARPIFFRLVDVLDEMGILTEGDLDIVASLAEVKALGRKYKALVDERGATQTTTTGRKVYSGDYLVWRDMQAAEQKLLNDLGLTPASRTRVAVAVAEAVDEFAEFMARRSTNGQAQAQAQTQAEEPASAD